MGDTSRGCRNPAAILDFVASKESQSREGNAPVKDRLLTTLFLAGILHAIVILGITVLGLGR